jgi:hypothetical protein
MIFGLSILFKFMMVGISKESGNEDTSRKSRFMTTALSAVLFTVSAVCFILSVMQ